MAGKAIEDRMTLIKENSDFPGARDMEKEQEKVNYHQNSNVRIWYNDIPADFDIHWHEAFEILLPVNNWYEADADGTTYHLEPGDILVIPPGTMHSLHAPEEGERFIFLINSAPLKTLKDYGVLMPLLTQCIFITPKSEPQIYEQVRHTLHKAREVYFSDVEFREMTIYSHILQLMTTIGRSRLNKLNHINTASVKRVNYLDRFNTVLEYINTHYMDDITLEQAADYCGFSKFYFAKLFKEYSNTTFLSYLTFRRLSVAEEMLVNTDRSITDIAFSSGFASISTFNRCFKQLRGCTPTHYKELYQNRKS